MHIYFQQIILARKTEKALPEVSQYQGTLLEVLISLLNHISLPLTLIAPCGVRLDPGGSFSCVCKNHRYLNSDIFLLCQAIYCFYVSDNVVRLHAVITSV